MTTTSPRATSPAPTISQLIDHAVRHGISVCWTPPTDPRHAAYAHTARTIWLRRDLTTAETRSLLAHELGHAAYGDHGPQPPHIEARAWRYAARLLITLDAYAAAEAICPDPAAIAAELDVTREVVTAWHSIMETQCATAS